MSRRWITALLIVMVAVVGLAGPGGVAAQRPDAPPYGKSGPYAVGVIPELVIKDAVRPLTVTVWYPAVAGNGPRATYSLRGAGNAVIGAAPARNGSPFPLIVFSHGFAGARDNSTVLTEHLAQWGFVVIAADHIGTNTRSLAASGARNNLLTSLVERPADVLRQIDYAAALNVGNSLLRGLIDTSRVGVIGHSMGGYTAVAAGGARVDFDALQAYCTGNPPPAERPGNVCTLLPAQVAIAGLGLKPDSSGLLPAISDPRIKAIVPLAPWNAPVFGPKGLAALTIPTLIMVGAADEVTPAARDSNRIYDQIGSAEKALVTFADGTHLLFLDPCKPSVPLQSICDEPVWDKPRVYDLTNHFATAFFTATLKGDRIARAALDPRSVAFAGIEYRATFSQ